MSSPILVKGVLGFSAVGITVTGVAYVGGFFNRGKAVSDLLKVSNPEKRLITATEGSDSKGKEAGRLYREDNKNKNSNEDAWKLKDGVKPTAGTITSDVEAPKYFIEECKSRASQKTSGADSDLYQSVLKYCTRDTLVSDLISENGKGKKLLTNSSPEADGTEVGKLYRDQNKVDGKSADDGGMESGGSKKSGDTLPTDYKDKCAKKAEEKAFELTDIKYLNVLNGCSR